MAEETVADVFNQAVEDVAAQLEADTQVNEEAAHSLAKMVTMKAATEKRTLESIIDQVESWAHDQAVKKAKLAEVIAQISNQISQETGAAAEQAVAQAQAVVDQAMSEGQDLSESAQVEEEVISAALFDLNVQELEILAAMEEEAEEEAADEVVKAQETAATAAEELDQMAPEVEDEGFLSGDLVDECEAAMEAYIAQISDLHVSLAEQKE